MASCEGLRVHAVGDAVEISRSTTGRRVVAVSLLLVGLVGVQVCNSSPRALPLLAWLACVVAPLVIGLALMLFRHGIRLEPVSGMITRWWSLGPLGRREHRHLDGFREVVVRREVVRSNSRRGHTAVRFLVALSGKTTFWPICRLSDPVPARRIGEVLAKVVWRPMQVELAPDAVSSRPPEELDWSLSRRLAGTGSAPRPPRIESSEHLSVRETDSGYAVERPGPALPALVQLMAETVVPGIGGFDLEVEHDGLRVTRHRASGDQVSELDGPSIEEVMVAQRGVGNLRRAEVVIFSDDHIERLDARLDLDEAHQIAALIRAGLCRERRQDRSERKSTPTS